MFSLHRFLLFFFLFFSLSSCGPKSPSSNLFSASSSESFSSDSCEISGSHSIFSIRVDGADIGREVRSVFFERIDSHLQRFVLSHSVKNEKMGRVLFQTIHVLSERTDAVSGRILNTSFIKKDQVSTDTVDVTYKDGHFSRSISSISSFKKTVPSVDDNFPLSGNEYLGFRIFDIAQEISLGKLSPPDDILYFDAKLNSSVRLRFSFPEKSFLSLNGQQLSGNTVNIFNFQSGSLIVSLFFDDSGLLWSEKYPEIHEERVRLIGSFSLPSDTSELIVGLHSNAYIYDPNVASRATFHLISSPDRLDKLDMLSEPSNQSVTRISDTVLELTVYSGSPDADSLPVSEDLSSSLYIRPSDPIITDALLFLKSSGKKGSLPEKRRLNATPVVAQSSVIQKHRAFWSDNEKVAGIILQYVSSLLPDKRHTFSMSDAVDTLKRGAGDCTEHAVLFASLMRAHGIPTRLVSGMLLVPGGVWAYHMWNSYWDGSSWRAIDTSTKTYRPGALYVSLGRGASAFKDVRDRLADFMWRTFSGVSFDLVDAANEGESLFLARPVSSSDRDMIETSLFNAVVLSDRGDFSGALSLLDYNIDPLSRSINVRLMRIELFLKASRFQDAIDEISSLRDDTSLEENTFLLDKFEFQALLNLGDFSSAKLIMDRLFNSFPSSSINHVFYEANYLFYSGNKLDAISLLEKSLLSSDISDIFFPTLLHLFSSFVSMTDNVDSALLKKAYISAGQSLKYTYFVDSASFATISLLLYRLGHPVFASWYLDHALSLSPKNEYIRHLNRRISDFDCDSF